MERSINLEELESTPSKSHRRRLECIVFVNRVEVDKSDLLLQDEWMEMEAIAHRLSREATWFGCLFTQ